MKTLVRYLPLVFVGVAVITVAHFAGPLMVLDVLGYVLAVGIALAIFSAGYYSSYRDDRKGTKQEKVQAVRRWAWVVWGIFGVIDGILNLSALYTKAVQRPIPPKLLEWIGIVLVGIFPAIAAGCLGIFSALLDGLPSTAKEKRAERDSVANAGRRWLIRQFSVPRPTVAKKAKEKKAPPEVLHGLAPKVRRERLLGIWGQNGRKTFTELADVFGVSRQTIGNDFAALAKDGKVKRQGGQIVVGTLRGRARQSQAAAQAAQEAEA